MGQHDPGGMVGMQPGVQVLLGQFTLEQMTFEVTSVEGHQQLLCLRIIYNKWLFNWFFNDNRNIVSITCKHLFTNLLNSKIIIIIIIIIMHLIFTYYYNYFLLNYECLAV